MIATHMDAIGMRVSGIQDGFLHITNIGGIDIRVLPGMEVTIHASGSGEELPGVIAMPPPPLLPDNAGDGVMEIEHLLVDTGLLAREVEKKVRVGDLVSFANEPVELAGDGQDLRALRAVLRVLRHQQEQLFIGNAGQAERLGLFSDLEVGGVGRFKGRDRA